MPQEIYWPRSPRRPQRHLSQAFGWLLSSGGKGRSRGWCLSRHNGRTSRARSVRAVRKGERGRATIRARVNCPDCPNQRRARSTFITHSWGSLVSAAGCRPCRTVAPPMGFVTLGFLIAAWGSQRHFRATLAVRIAAALRRSTVLRRDGLASRGARPGTETAVKLAATIAVDCPLLAGRPGASTCSTHHIEALGGERNMRRGRVPIASRCPFIASTTAGVIMRPQEFPALRVIHVRPSRRFASFEPDELRDPRFAKSAAQLPGGAEQSQCADRARRGDVLGVTHCRSSKRGAG
jgi:hypothetical protein